MSRYRKIEVRTWADQGFRNLSPIAPSGQGLWFFLLTGPHTGPIPGLFRAGRASMAEELNWELEDFDEAFQEVFANGMAKADFKARLVWLPNALKHNKPESPNVVRSWRVELDLLPECPLKAEAMASTREMLKMIGPSYVDAFDSLSKIGAKNGVSSLPKPSRKASPKTMPNQEQEQEQEQNKDMSGKNPDAPPPETDVGDMHERREKRRGEAADEKCGRWLFGLVKDVNPDAKPPNIGVWGNDIRLMRERDGRTHEQICDLFQWVMADPFWCANVLCPAKLREKWDQLTMQRLRPAKQAAANWWATEQASIDKGAEYGLKPRNGEKLPAFQERVRAAIDGKPAAVAAPPPAVAPAAEPKRSKPEGMAPLRTLVGPVPKAVVPE